MPAYDDSPWFALFFIVYIITNTYIFINLFLAVIYNSYRAHLKVNSLVGAFAESDCGQARSQDLEKGEAFLKEYEKCKRPWPEFSLLVNQNHTVCPKIETEFLGSSDIPTFFQPKNRWSPKKKKVFTEIETDFLAKIGNSYVFSAQKQVVSKKKKKKRSSPKVRLIFRPKSEILKLFQAKSRHVLHNFGTQFPLGGAVFNFSPKISLKSTKNVRFCILHKPMGGGAWGPPPPPGYASDCGGV